MTAKAVIAYAIGLPAYVLVKALTPNFFARGDTKTPVKYSIIVFLSNLCFAIILMKPFGHVGIATATTISAFVSLWQYLKGLHKRCFWSCPRPLIIKILKILSSSVIMGISIKIAQYAFNLYFNNWLTLSLLPKLIIFTILCILGVVTFLITAKFNHIIDFAEITSLIRKRRNSNVK